MTTYHVMAKPKGENRDGQNKGGMVVYLAKASEPEYTWEEVGRVAFERTGEILHPEKDYDEALDDYIAKAEKSIEIMNELEAKRQALLADAGKLA